MMKKIIFPLLLACCAVLHAEDCAKNSDACSAGSKPVSPFLAASAQPVKTTAAPAAVKPAPAVQPAQAPLAATAAVPAPAPAPEAGTSSNPLWLLFIGAVFAALYFYLGGKKKRGKRR